MLRHLLPALVILMTFATVATALDLQNRQVRTSVLHERERAMGKTLTRDSHFSEVPHLSARSRCEEVQPPEALTTPEPLLTPARERMRVKVSFIIGTDGRVHAPLILESAGPAGDRRILQTVRTWRYRPATCNGVPTETEGKVEFSSR
jgi:TonB family protein